MRFQTRGPAILVKQLRPMGVLGVVSLALVNPWTHDLLGIDTRYLEGVWRGVANFSAVLFALACALVIGSTILKMTRLLHRALDTAGLVCPDCGYDLRGVPEGACPECGKAFTYESLRTVWGIKEPADKGKEKEEDEDNASSGGRT